MGKIFVKKNNKKAVKLEIPSEQESPTGRGAT